MIMVVGLYTSRITLQALGASDYGIYNVVGSFVALFNIVSGAFSVSIARFLTMALGRKDEDTLRQLYAMSLIIQCGLGLLISVLVGIFGSYYVLHIMVMDDARRSTALVVLGLSMLGFFVQLINIPYNALIIAHERMRVFAYMGLLEVILKLGIAFSLLLSSSDRLILYSFLIFVSTLVLRIVYAWYCRQHFPECHFHWTFNKEIFRKMLAFIGWAFLGNGAVVIREQGTSIVLNLFAGPAVNAARAIATNVSTQMSSFVTNFMQAAQPQITKLSSVKQYEEMQQMIMRCSRASYLLMLILSLPVMKNVDFILEIWLGRPPFYTNIFLQCTLIISLIDSLKMPLLYGVLADGRIKRYEILLFIIFASTPLIAYFMLSVGAPYVIAYYVLIATSVVVDLLLIWQSAVLYKLKVKDVITEIAIPIGKVTLVAGLFTYFISIRTGFNFLDFLLESGFIGLVTLIVVLFLGLKPFERNKMKDIIMKKLGKGR